MAEGMPNLFELLISLGAIWFVLRKLLKKKVDTPSQTSQDQQDQAEQISWKDTAVRAEAYEDEEAVRGIGAADISTKIARSLEDAPAVTPEPIITDNASEKSIWFSSVSDLQHAIIMKEILDPPKGLRE